MMKKNPFGALISTPRTTAALHDAAAAQGSVGQNAVQIIKDPYDPYAGLLGKYGALDEEARKKQAEMQAAVRKREVEAFAAEVKAGRAKQVRALATEIYKAILIQPGMMIIDPEERAARAIREAEAFFAALEKIS